MWPFRDKSARNVRTQQPYWLMRNGIADAGVSLDRSLECEIAIVGAGITGALVANSLTGPGRDVVVLEQLDVALGSTSASTALLQYEIDTHLVDLVPALGWEDARLAYRAGVDSIDIIQSLAGQLSSSVNFERRDSLYLAHTQADVAVLMEELAARERAGLDVRWIDARELVDRYKCHRPGGILSAAGAQVDPFRLARALLARSQGRGARVFARTRIAELEELGGHIRLRTESGHTISAGHVVICCGYESLKFLPEPVAKLHSTFALATEPTAAEGHAVESTLIWESSRPYLYLRGTPDGRLVVGGQDTPFNSAEARDAALPGKLDSLGRQYRSLFGEDLPPVAYSWAGTFGETADGLPYIGRAPGMSPRLLFALCFGGNGITYSAHAGPILKGVLEHSPHPLQRVFGFDRPTHAAPGRARTA